MLENVTMIFDKIPQSFDIILHISSKSKFKSGIIVFNA